MATLFLFENIKAWQKARVLNDRLHRVMIQEKPYRDFMLRDQVNDTAGSLMDDIAIGFGEEGMSDPMVYLERALADSTELQSQLYRMLDRQYMTGFDFKIYNSMIREIQLLIRSEMNRQYQLLQSSLQLKMAN